MTTPKTGLNALIDDAVECLRNGGVAALPTDTLYALSAAAHDAAAVQRVYAIKGREDGKPLPLFVDGMMMAERVAQLDNRARVLGWRFWPGPLTIVCSKQPGFASDALAGGETVALRVPDNSITLDIIERLGSPITGTSANRSGGADPASPEEVRTQLGEEVDIIFDDGPSPVGISSTIVDCSGPELRILRQGVVSAAAIAEALAPPAELT